MKSVLLSGMAYFSEVYAVRGTPVTLWACFEALLSKQRRHVSQVPQMSFPSNLRQLRGQTVSMPAFFHFGSSFIL